MSQSIVLKQLVAKPITPELFQPYGQLITPASDGKAYDHTDAILNLSNGTPRFYLMRLEHRGRKFDRITRHNLWMWTPVVLRS